MNNTKVKVLFTQQGTWGGVGFAGILQYKRKDIFDINDMLGFETNKEVIKEDQYELVIEITEGPEQYIGLIIHPGQNIPGLFAGGYEHSLSGKCFIGNISIGNNAKELMPFKCPEQVFELPISYLHVDGESLTDNQKVLLLEAVRFDKKAKFPAGATITKLFTREQLEGASKGKIFYA